MLQTLPQTAPSPVSRRLRWPLAIAALLLLAYFSLAITASRTKSPTFDEIVHITAGYNAWTNHDQRFDPGNGDFIKRWAALPLLLSRPAFPSKETPEWLHGEFFLVSREFMSDPQNDPAGILFQTRMMVTLVGVALGALVFACSRRLFGTRGGLVSLFLFALCPHMLAHGALVSTDLTLSAALLAATWMLWRLLHRVSWPTLLGSLLACGLLVVSKMSAVIIAPIAAVLIVVRLISPAPWEWALGRPRPLASRPVQAAVIAGLMLLHVLVGWGAIWTVFEFKYEARGDREDTRLVLLRSDDADISGPIATVSEFCHEHHLLPEGFLKGMEELVGISQRRPSFLNGHWKVGGQTWFFPFTFWAKTPPALLAVLLLGIVGAAFTWRRRGATPDRTSPPGRRWLYEAIPLLVLLLCYAAVAMRQQVNIGHRHILALYPPLYILAGSVALLLPSPRRLVEAALVLLLGWYAVDSFSVRPHYLAYFSPMVGGPSQGYRRLADSSLDWGQDLPALKTWLETHDAGETVFFSYFGTGSPEGYGIESKRLPGFPEWRELMAYAYTPGVYAISATMFQQLYSMTFGPWTRAYETEYLECISRLKLTPENTRDTAQLGAALQALPEDVWQEAYGRYEKLRFARLCAWLRATHREPEAKIGYSILVWHLDAKDLHAALWDAPVELEQTSADASRD